MVKEEEHGDNQAWDDGHKDPADWKVPELNEEDGPVGTRWPERGADLQRLLVEEASSPMCGMPMKTMILMAAAYSARPMRM
jgi:hypothetical protein